MGTRFKSNKSKPNRLQRGIENIRKRIKVSKNGRIITINKKNWRFKALLAKTKRKENLYIKIIRNYRRKGKKYKLIWILF